MLQTITKNSLVYLSLLLAGCGSLQTLSPGAENKLLYDKRYELTDCNSIPRIYSGVSLDVCMAFIGPPRSYDETASRGMLSYYLWDIVFSAVIDTAALPYTTIRQAKDGRYILRKSSPTQN